MEVYSIICSMNPRKSCGPNSIPTKLLKGCPIIYSYIISLLINKSFNEYSFPDQLKIAQVITTYKMKDKSLCENYRPMSLLSNISKIYERTFHTRLYDFLEDCNSLYIRQFGFRKSHSTEHTLIDLTENIKKNLDNQRFSCCVFIDLEKAINTVNHEILLHKLEYYGVRATSLKWMAIYLSNRQQAVQIW